MRILHLTGKHGDVRARRAARALREQGHEVAFVMGTDFSPEDDTLIEIEPVDGLTTLQLNQRFAHKLREEILRFEPDIVHAHELDFLFLATAIWTKEVNEKLLDGEAHDRAGFTFERLPVPLVYDTHEYERGRPFIWQNQRTKRVREWQENNAIKYADHVIAPSPSIAHKLKYDHTLPTMPTVVVNSPPKPTRSVEQDRAGIRERLQIKEGEIAVGFAGYVTPDRMLQQLGRAVSMLGPKWRLYIMGQTHNSPLEKELAMFGATFLGILPYPWPEAMDEGHTLLDGLAAMDVLFSGSDVEAWPNWKMGAPNKFFEYAFSGRPQIISEAHDPMIWCEKYGTGLVYNNTVRGLVDALEKARTMTVDAEKFIKDFAFNETQGPRLEEAYQVAKVRREEKRQDEIDKLAGELEVAEKAAARVEQLRAALEKLRGQSTTTDLVTEAA